MKIQNIQIHHGTDSDEICILHDEDSDYRCRFFDTRQDFKFWALKTEP